ncbi:MAG: hypothetical protein ACK5KR_06180 [Breznakia sp.]
MMIISCPMKQEFVIETVESIERYTYKFEGKTGFDLKFSVNTEDIADAIAVAKAAIKATDIGSILYIQIKAG